MLDKIDVEFLYWKKYGFSFGGWCVGLDDNLCLVWGDYLLLKFGFGVCRFEDFVVCFLLFENF